MKLPYLPVISLVLAALCLNSAGLCADTPKYGLAADNRIFAQELVNRLTVQNPKLITAGMHCLAPGGSVQTIVASTLNVIGKASDPNDVDVGQQGFTLISPNPKKSKIGVMMPLHDRSGKLVGALALAFKYRDGDDEVKFLADAVAIRDRVAQDIADLPALFVAVP